MIYFFFPVTLPVLRELNQFRSWPSKSAGDPWLEWELVLGDTIPLRQQWQMNLTVSQTCTLRCFSAYILCAWPCT